MEDWVRGGLEDWKKKGFTNGKGEQKKTEEIGKEDWGRGGLGV